MEKRTSCMLSAILRLCSFNSLTVNTEIIVSCDVGRTCRCLSATQSRVYSCILVAFTEGLYTCTLWIVKSTDPRGMLKFLRITISHSTIQTQRQDSQFLVFGEAAPGDRVCTTYWGKNIKYSFLIMSTFPRETMQPYIPFRSIISAHIYNV